MRYEVWCGTVKVYESDIECDVRVNVDGAEVYSLNGTPKFQGNAKEGYSRILVGGTTEAVVVDAKGKDLKVLDEAWEP